VFIKAADNELVGECSVLARGGLFLFATGPHWLWDTPRYLRVNGCLSRAENRQRESGYSCPCTRGDW